MNATDLPLVRDTSQLLDAVEAACARIAPTWPLDQLIAVNPCWGWLPQGPQAASAELGVLAGTSLAAPRAFARSAWSEKRLHRDHLERACQLTGQATSRVAELEQILAQARPAADPGRSRLPLVADLAPNPVLHAAQLPADTVVHQLSQQCAAYFDDGQAHWPIERRGGLWGSWKRQVAHDRGLCWQRGHAWLQQQLASWPADPMDAIAHGMARLPLAPRSWPAYLTALLLSVNGWASWCAYQGWQARLQGRDDPALRHLLACRLAWDVLLHEDQQVLEANPGWATQWDESGAEAAALAGEQADDWLLQLALELAYQDPLCRQLHEAGTLPTESERATVQAVFCIDVRSEVFRRALESADSGIRTRGFAGFFGLPIAYAPAGSALVRPQLPGLLAPALQVSEAGPDRSLGEILAQQRRSSLGWRERWSRWRSNAASAFSFVESCGLAYGAKLLGDSLPSEAPPRKWEDTGVGSGMLARARPQLPADMVASDAGTDLAASVLRAMGLAQGCGRLVLLAGHGSQSANNPHAAGLDCGACGGQTGEVNARALAALLNDPAVRHRLAARGSDIPQDTHFVPGLHNTTTDDVQLFDVEDVPASLAGALAQLQAALRFAGGAARRERAPSLGLPSDAPAAVLDKAVRQRANDWAQVRPEWGLAGNAAFVVAPRARTRHMRLAGRSFLHDYDWRQDQDLSVLTLIMTAPMVVTHWINMQYHASTVDNVRYGSGNKVLHNVVGGHIGVFEGNGGDLRIGLPLQSLHDGKQWRHEPLRLSVFIEAPAQAIESVMQRHAVVQQLVDGGWLHLLHIDPASGAVSQWWRGAWLAR